MSDQRDKQEFNYVERFNANLKRSLRRCHVLIEDCRQKIIAANSNDPPFMLAADKEESEDELID